MKVRIFEYVTMVTKVGHVATCMLGEMSNRELADFIDRTKRSRRRYVLLSLNDKVVFLRRPLAWQAAQQIQRLRQEYGHERPNGRFLP